VKLFALSFGMRVVSGIAMNFQFGTNWAGFMAKAGNVAGPLLGSGPWQEKWGTPSFFRRTSNRFTDSDASLRHRQPMS
jgi:hypothetical protein